MGGTRRAVVATALAIAVWAAAAACSGDGSGSPPTTGAAPSSEVTTTTRKPTTSSTSLPEFEALITSAMAASGAPGALVSASVPGRLAWSRAYGVSDVATRAPMDPAMHFRIGGMTSLFTCALLLELAEEQLLSLDDRVASHVDGAPNGSATLAQLCQGTSGVPDYWPNPSFIESVAVDPTAARSMFQLFSYAGSSPMFPPGGGWYPSANALVLLGLIMETAAERPVGEMVAERFIGPMGLTSTTYPSASVVELPEPSPRGYWSPFPGDPPADYTALSPSVGDAAGAMVSTLRDVERFVATVGDGLHGTSADSARQRDATVAIEGRPEWMRAGIGFLELGPLVASAGAMPGFASAVVYDRDTATTVVVVFNDSTAGVDPPLFLAAAIAATVVPDPSRIPFSVDEAMALVPVSPTGTTG